MRTCFSMLFALALALPACESNPDPEQACEDTADAIAKAAVRCNLGEYPEVFGAVVLDIGGCDRVIAIRDIDALYSECFPQIEKLACSELQFGKLPASCEEQLMVNGI